MLHNSGAYGPNETPHNANTPVNMSQVNAPINIGRSLQNMSDIGQQPLRGPSGHYNLPHYSAYNHPNLDMRSNLDAFSKEIHHQYLTQTTVPRWPNGLTPLNLNAQSTYVPNMHNFHAPYDKTQPNSHTPMNLKDSRTMNDAATLDVAESSSKTSDSQNYLYNANANVFSNYNQSCQPKVASERPTLDFSKRRSLENTVKLIETILINTTKDSQNKTLDNSENTTDQNNKISENLQETSNNLNKNNDKQVDENNSVTDSDKKALNTAEIFARMAKTLDAIKQSTTSTTSSDVNVQENKSIEEPDKRNNTTEKSDSESETEPNEAFNTTNDSNSVDDNQITQQETSNSEIKVEKIKIKVEIEIGEAPVDNGSEDYQLEFCRDLNGMAREDVDLSSNQVVFTESSIIEAQYAVQSGSKSNNYYECVHCHLLFNHPKRFLIHAKWHTFGLTNERRLQIARDREHQRKQRREAKIVDQLHKALEEDGTTYPCKDCTKVFTTKGSLKNHRTRFHSGRVRECDICGEVMMGWAGLKAHTATHAAPFKCNICNKLFRHKHSLFRHKETHMDDEEKTLRCELCGKLFATLSRYKEHQRVHIREERGAVYQCSYCAKAFKQAYSLTIHERTHRNEKPFVCDICNSSYGTNSSLKRHMKVSHNSAKPFECAQCRRCFTTAKALNGHIARVHFDPTDPVQVKRRNKNTKPRDPLKKLQKGAKSKKNKKDSEDLTDEISKEAEDIVT